MSDTTTTEFDFDAMQITAMRLEDSADDLDATLEKAIQRCWDTVVAEASKNTAGGEPAPIYGDVLNALAGGFSILTETKIAQITAQMRGDAATLRAVIAAAQGATDAAVASLDAVAQNAYAQAPSAVEAYSTSRSIQAHVRDAETVSTGVSAAPTAGTGFRETAGVSGTSTPTAYASSAAAGSAPRLTADQWEALRSGEAHIDADGDVELAGGGILTETGVEKIGMNPNI